MKKLFCLLIALLLCFTAVNAAAEEPVYELLCGLLDGRTFTLTVTAENAEGLDELLAPFGSSAACELREENGRILLDVSFESGASLSAAADAEGIALETSLWEIAPIRCTWEELQPVVTGGAADTVDFRVDLTGPDRELIAFSCKITGSRPEDCHMAFTATLITGPGAVYGLWDDLDVQGGITARETAITFDQSMFTLEAEGSEQLSEDGARLREDRCSILLDDEEAGTVTLLSGLSVR